MKNIISLILLAVVIFLGYLLYLNIKEPIKFMEEKTIRKNKVVSKLESIRSAQEIYKLVTNEYASSFDTLSQVIANDSIRLVTIFGDKDDLKSTEEFREVISYKSAKDSLVNLLAKNKLPALNLDSLRYIPFTTGKTFDISADTMTYQSTLVNVVQVGTQWKNFMGKYADKSYCKYDNVYDPNSVIKFGDMNSPNLAGNWPMN